VPHSARLPALHRFFWPDGLPEANSSPWIGPVAQEVLWWMLVAFATIDVVRPISVLTGSWWFVFFVLWIVPWRQPIPTETAQVRIACWLSVLLLFGWLIYRTQTAAQVSLKTWHAFPTIYWLSPLSFPMRTTLATLITAALVVFPLRRIVGERATVLVIIASIPYASSYPLPGFSYPFPWQGDAIQAAIINLSDVALTLLIIAEVSFLLTRFPITINLIPGYRKLRMFAGWLLSGHLNALVAVCILYVGALAGCFVVERLRDSPDRNATALAFYSAILPASLLIVMLSALATWRSLARAGRRNLNMVKWAALGRAIVASTALLVTSFGVFFLMPLAGKDLSEGIRLVAGRPWQVVEDHHLLRITGEIVPGIGDAVESVLDKNPEIRVVVLNSSGGDMDEGYSVAKAIQSHHLSTAVSHECASACGIAFVAGLERILIPGTRLGFHACRERVWYDECNYRQYRKFMADKGIDQGFVQKALAVPAASMWYPTVEELMAAHVVTRTTKPTFDRDPAPLQTDTRAPKSPE